ncbi:MAG TPA: response regulator [Thermoanaerobaculia bacterium]|nr:response regulator [Thermoanaerobaculia bacterium]
METEPDSQVLIADADPVVSQQILKRLHGAGIASDAVANGRSALEKLRGGRYSLVLLDMSLPQVAVEPIVEYLSAVPLSRRPVIVVLDRAYEARSLDVDLVQIVLRKPCDLTRLSEIVGSCVASAVRPDEATLPAA